MSLLAPLGLLGLIALPLIVLLHMRHTTPRRRPVPTLRFWLAAEPAPIQDTRLRRPPITLPLLLQLLVALVLAAALAQPVGSSALAWLGLTSSSGPTHLIILLDGSTSMTARDPGATTTRYAQAREAATARLAALRDSDVATVITLGTNLTTQGAADPATMTLLRQRLLDQPAPGGRADLNAGLRLARSLLLPDRANQIVLYSDGALAVDPPLAASIPAPIEFVPVGGLDQANVAVVDLVARADTRNPALSEVLARVINFTPEALTVPVMLTVDGLALDRQLVELAANGGEAELVWPLPAGGREATVQLEHGDRLDADNVASLILREGDEQTLAQRILLISDTPDVLYRGLTALPGAHVTISPVADAAAALTTPYDLVIYAGAAPSRQELDTIASPLLIVGPPAGDLFVAEGDLVPAPVASTIHANDPLLAGVDLAGVTFGPTPRFSLPGASVVASDAGLPLIARMALGQSPAVIFSFDLAQSNLPRRVAFPILLANTVRELAPSAVPAAVPLGDPLRYRPRAAAESLEIVPPNGVPVTLAVAAATTDPRSREVSFLDTGDPGTYAITELDAAGNVLGQGRFIVNAGQAQESDLRPNVALASALAQARPGSTGPAASAGLASLWPLLIAAAVAVVAIEAVITLLPRWRSAVYVSPGRR